MILAFVIWSTITFGQTPDIKDSKTIVDSNKLLQNESSVKVIYTVKESDKNKPVYYLNDELVNEPLLSTLNPMLIESINVVQGNILVDNILYYGQIRVKTKNNYNPKSLSLQEIKEKYTKLKSKSSIFMIDGVIVNADYSNYFVDENYILSIIVDRIENPKENIDLGLIKLLTKSEENINPPDP